MTESEIRKALECCSKDEINGLNIFTYGDVPMRSLLKYALDLINRKNAEIERAKAEAIKEVAERVKGKMADKRLELDNEANWSAGWRLCYIELFDVLSKIAKEMGVEL